MAPGGRVDGLRVRGREGLRVRLIALLVLALGGAGIALTLTPSTALDTFVSSSAPDYAATQAMYRQFGSDPVVVLVKGPLSSLLQPAEMRTLTRLEACLSGQQVRFDSGLAAYLPLAATTAKPEGGAGSPCARLMRARAAQVVYGPASFLNHAVAAVNSEVGSVTVSVVETIRTAEAEARNLAHAHRLDRAQTSAAVQAAGELALEHELAAAEQSNGTRGNSAGSGGGSAGSGGGSATQGLLAGIPSIADAAFLRQIVFGSATNASTPAARFAYLFPSDDSAIIQVRLRAGLGERQRRQAIGWVRQAVDSPRFRIPGVSYTVSGEPVLLSDLGGEISGQLILLLAVAVVVMALVLLALLRRSLRLLPLLTALAAVAITFGLTAVFGGSLTLADVAVFPVLLGLAVDYGVQFRSGTPRGMIASAALATAAGFLALLISPVPMVQGFGLLLVVGVIVAFAAAAFGGPQAPGAPLAPPRLVPRPLLASIYGAGEILAGVVPSLLRHPRRVLALAAAVAIGGWALSAGTAVQSDITKLVPSGMPALRHLDQLEATTGTSGEVDVLVSAGNVTSARTVAWMRSYERRLSARLGAGGNCARASICPALSLPSLLDTAGGTLSSVPGYFQRSVLTADHRHALLAFGIRLMPLSRQRQVVAQMRSALDPPRGTVARLAGAAVLAADAEGALASSADRLLMLALSLALVTAVLLAALRDVRRVLVPLIPIALATGWSALLVDILRIPLNPMSATLGTLVIAITTEFSVLLSERVRRQQSLGLPRGRAIDDAYRSTGIAVLTSALTAIAGFAVLVVSDITMLRDFGLLALVDLSVSLAGVMLVLPATIALVDRRSGPEPARPGHAAEDPQLTLTA